MILPIIMGCFILFMVITSPISLIQGVRFFLYQIFGMWLPGIALTVLLRLPYTDSLEKISWGYGLGFIINILEYFLLAAFQGLFLIIPLQILLGIASVIILVYNYKGTLRSRECNVQILKCKTDIHSWIALSVFLILVFIIRFFTYYGFNLLPISTQDVTFSTQDLLFYIGNAISAKKGFPIQEFRFAGEPFKYHYFGSIHLAVASLSTGIDALKLEFCLAWIPSLFLVVTSFWCLMRQMSISFKKTIIGMCILLFTAGIELLVYVAYQHKMYQSPFGWDIGLTFGILTLIFVYMQYHNKKLHWGLCIATLLSFFVCTGSKAPIAVVILFVLGYICASWLLTAGKRSMAFIYGLLLVITFVAVFWGFVSEGMNTLTTNTTGLKFDLTGHLYECGLGKIYFDWVAQGLPGVIGKILIFAMFFFGCNMVANFLFVVFTPIFLKKGWRNILSFEGALVAGGCFGLLLTLVTKQSGNSQMYFAMTSFPLIVIVSMKMWNDYDISNKSRMGNIFYGSFGIMLLLSFISFIQILWPSYLTGYNKLTGKSNLSQESNSLTYEEMQAYGWLKNNTHENAICVTNVILEDEQYQSFIVGVCTERQMYMEGWRYAAGTLGEDTVLERRNIVHAFFNCNQTAKEELVKAGVDYVIWTQRYGTFLEEYESFYGNMVYENNAVKVYLLEN